VAAGRDGTWLIAHDKQRFVKDFDLNVRVG